jgi:hypothetical protein
VTVPRCARYSARVRTRLAIALVVIALLLGLGTAALIAWTIVRRAERPKFTNTPSVIQQIQSLSELVTVKYVIQKVVPAETPAVSLIDQLPGRSDKLILLAHGVVKAGVDLSRVRAEDVRVSDGTIEIVLPHAVVTDGYLDENATQVLERTTGLLRPFDRKLETEARTYARAEIIRAARQAGIEREANQRAKEQLGNFLQSLGYKEVTVRSRGEGASESEMPTLKQ